MSDRKPLLPDDWEKLAPLVDQLLDASPAERPALLDTLAGENAARRAELERLVAEFERDVPLLERPAVERFPQLRHEDDGPPLPELLGGRYRIEREVGRGGMARVYLAYDSRHSRRVAVKVIRPEIASALARERFLREIGIAARLRHPNIMPLYDSGDVDETLYFVMPFEEGKSLRARLDKEQRLGIPEAVSILRDVARALAYAHEQNVVHRDIKPDNVLLSGDAAVVTDFGIAKALTLAATEAGTGPLTHAGTAIGTPAYMAPEQAIGDPTVDYRADIYAFGCLAYEVFAGVTPFAGTTAHEIISAQLSERPKALAAHRPDVPQGLARLIERCLEKSPAARPASASELLEVLGTTTTTKGPAVSTRRPSRRIVAAVVGLAVLVLAGWCAAPTVNRGGPVTLAVLPLEVTGDAAQDLARGLSEDLANALVGKRWLRVKSRGGAANYRGQGDIETRAVCDLLRVSYLLMGSARGQGDSVAVTVRLMNCAEDAIVWANKFNVGHTDLQALRDEVVDSVADRLKPAAGRYASAFVETTRKRRGNSRGYSPYLLGKKMIMERTRPNAMKDAAEKFAEAIEADSNSAEAWSGMSLALALSAAFQAQPIDSVGPKAKQSADRAIKLDRTLSEPHVALGIVHGLYWQWAEAETQFKTALTLSHSDIEARIQYIRLLNVQNRRTEALAQIDSALEDDPVSSSVLGFKSMEHLLWGRLDSAMIWSDRAMQISNENLLVRIFRMLLLVKMHRLSDARELYLSKPAVEPYMIYTLAVAGDTAEVRRQLEKLQGTDSRSEGTRAYAYFAVGDTARAFAALERGIDRRDVWPILSPPGLPVFDAVRDTPRYRAILKRVGLSPR